MINDVLMRNLVLAEMFMQSCDHARFIEFVSCSELTFDAKLTATVVLPLRLKLPEGCEYSYENYTGTKIKDLVIFN